MHRIACLFLVVGLLFTLSSCTYTGDKEKEEPVFDVGQTIAEVNGYELSSERFEESYINHLIKTGRNDTREERFAHLQTLIHDILLARQAEKYQLLDEEFDQHMKRKEREAVADYYYQTAFLDTLTPPTEEQVQTAFYNSKIKIYASQLHFTTKEEAETYYRRLEDGESFLDLANELYQTAVYDSSAGYLGELSYFGVDHDFAEAAYAVRAGEYTEPVRTRLGYYIIKVHNRVANPLIPEAEYNQKRQGILEQTKRRIMNIEGDAFVREFMQDLQVQSNTDHIRELYERIRQISDQEESEISGENFITEKNSVTTSDMDFLREQTNEELVLASYILNGQELYFTAEDYFFWLPELSLTEARTRTAASVGRALRNEVFARTGEKQGLANTEYVDFKKKQAAQLYKTWIVKKYLTDQPATDIPEEELKIAYQSMGFNSLKKATFTGWVIARNSYEEIEKIIQQVEEGKSASSFSNYFSYDGSDIRELYAIRDYALKVPLHQVTVVGTGDKFYAVYVHDRNIEITSFEEARDQVQERAGRFYNIAKEVRKLRDEATIRIDSANFEALMGYYDDPSLTTNQPAK